jgi:DnaK suppressor protein
MSGLKRPSLINSIRGALELRLKTLRRSVNSELEELGNDAEEHHLADVDDLGGDAVNEDTTFALMQLGSDELEQIGWALQRIEDGSYGQCEDCDKPIPEVRLLALPLATRCIECQRVAEGDGLLDQRQGRGWSADTPSGRLSDAEDRLTRSARDSEESFR